MTSAERIRDGLDFLIKEAEDIGIPLKVGIDTYDTTALCASIDNKIPYSGKPEFVTKVTSGPGKKRMISTTVAVPPPTLDITECVSGERIIAIQTKMKELGWLQTDGLEPLDFSYLA